jgi:hypothetical protein
MTRSLRWFWRVYIPLALLAVTFVLGAPMGSAIEARFWPVRTDQRMEDVVRSPDRLCWTWVSFKARDVVSDNMDVFMDTATDHLVLAVFERNTLMPWGRSRAVGIGEHHQSYCVLMPPSVGPADPLRLSQVAFYPGFLGFWQLAVRLPDIVSTPAPP